MGRRPRGLTVRPPRPPVRPTIERPPVAPPPAPRRTGKYGRPVWLTLRNTTLLLVPGSVVLNMMHANPLLIFAVACLGVVPLAAYMGEATEHLASRTGPAVGGLLNATFGNAAELIIAIVALKAGLVGPRQGVHHRQHPGQPAADHGSLLRRGRHPAVHAPLQPYLRGDQRRHARARGRRIDFSGALPSAASGSEPRARADSVRSGRGGPRGHLCPVAGVLAQDPPSPVRRRTASARGRGVGTAQGHDHPGRGHGVAS